MQISLTSSGFFLFLVENLSPPRNNERCGTAATTAAAALLPRGALLALLLALLLLPPADAAAGYPLVRDATTPDAPEVRVPCGTCASLVASDEPDGLEVVLVGADDVVFAPHAENADRCNGGGV